MSSPPVAFIVAESHFLRNADSSPTAICSDLEVAVQLDLRYHFSGPLCAAYWIDLCRSREYRHDRLLGTFDGLLPEIARVLRAGLPRRPRVNLLSLGPGDGEVDIRLLRQLRSAVEVASYRCVDFSFELLEYAVRRIRASGAADGLPLTALCADFTEPDGHETPSHDFELVLLTGYTFGNNNETRMLADIARWMRPGDHLLLDGRLHGLADRHGDLSREQRRSLTRSYEHPASNRFVFGPVETVTTARAGDVSFDYRIGRFVTKVPEALNVVIGCTGLDTRMRLTGDRVVREHLDLGSTTLYDFSALCAWLEQSPLRLRLALRDEETGVFLLQKPA